MEVSPNSMKIAVIGEARIGKTSIIQRYISGSFDEERPPSPSATFSTVPLTSADKTKKINMHIWDTAGQEQFHSIARMYYNGSDAVILVYNVADEKSFVALDFWINELKDTTDKSCLRIIVGNQADRIDDKKISVEKGMKFAQDNEALFFETSAKTGSGIQRLFQLIVDKKFPGFWAVPENPVPQEIAPPKNNAEQFDNPQRKSIHLKKIEEKQKNESCLCK